MQTIGNFDFVGLPIVVRAVTGTVHDENTQTTQHIESGRNLAGNVASVRSVTNNLQTLWLKMEDGKETPIKIQTKIDVRPGHRLQVFYAADSRSDNLGSLVAIKNFNTGKAYDLLGAGGGKIGTIGFFKVPLLSRITPFGVVFLIMCLALFLSAIYAGFGWQKPLALGVVTAIIPFVWQHISASDGLKASKAELDRLIGAAPSFEKVSDAHPSHAAPESFDGAKAARMILSGNDEQRAEAYKMIGLKQRKE
jgi:hypothetical protein